MDSEQDSGIWLQKSSYLAHAPPTCPEVWPGGSAQRGTEAHGRGAHWAVLCLGHPGPAVITRAEAQGDTAGTPSQGPTVHVQVGKEALS